MRAGRLHGSEFLGMAGAALLVGGLLLPWYATGASNSHSEVGGRTGSLTGWVVHPGEIAISLQAGWLVAMAGTLVMAGAAARRASDSERPRKPPGTI